MLEDRIIVQDRGIDAGLAALMQNANKGMDPAALMAMMNNNGGFGGNGGWWWIWIILIWFCWGGNGFGGRNAGALASELNTDANTNLLMQAINGNKDAISNLSTTLNCDINAVQSALNQINAGVSQISCDTKLSSCEVINAITSPENKSVITDTNLGLTISTDKQEIVNILRNQYNTYKARKESIAKCDEEMSKCQALLEKLDIPKEPTNTEDPRIKELQDEVNELKNIIKQASSMVPPPMKQMLPQNMQNVMKEVDQ